MILNGMSINEHSLRRSCEWGECEISRKESVSMEVWEQGNQTSVDCGQAMNGASDMSEVVMISNERKQGKCGSRKKTVHLEKNTVKWGRKGYDSWNNIPH